MARKPSPRRRGKNETPATKENGGWKPGYTHCKPDGTPNDELLFRIIELMCEGYSLLRISKVEMMPSFQQMYLWRLRYEYVDKALAEAERIHAAYIDDDCLEIADDLEGSAADVVDVMVAKERIATRQRRAAKLDPERHAERKQLPAADPKKLGDDGAPKDSSHITAALKAIEEKIAGQAKVYRGGPKLINVTPTVVKKAGQS